jgi:hypothetical protein
VGRLRGNAAAARILRSCGDCDELRRLEGDISAARMSGTGVLADEIHQTFQTVTRRYGLDGHLPPFDCSNFRPPRIEGGRCGCSEPFLSVQFCPFAQMDRQNSSPDGSVNGKARTSDEHDARDAAC